MGQLEIVEPCSEDWSAMTPAEGGRFCARCQETVVDLTRARRGDAERRVRSGEALCAQLALDERGRPVFAPEPPSRIAKLALRLAVVGAVATGCGRGEGAAPVEAAALEASEEDAALPCEEDAAPSGDLGIGSGSLLTGRGDEIPPAPPRPPAIVTTPTDPLRSNRNVPTAHTPPPVPPPPVTQPPVEHEVPPRHHHLRGRVAYRP